MRLVKRSILVDFASNHPDARDAIAQWLNEVQDAKWESPLDIQERYGSAKFLSGDRVIFKLRGNNYRLVVKVLYSYGAVEILQIGTHAQYDRWTL